MDKLSELNELIEDLEAVADKYYGKIKKDLGDIEVSPR